MKIALQLLTNTLNEANAERDRLYFEVRKHQGNLDYDEAHPKLNPDPRTVTMLKNSTDELASIEAEIADYAQALQALVKATEPVVEVKKFFRPGDADIEYNRDNDTVELRLNDDLRPEGETVVAVLRLRSSQALDMGVRLVNSIRPALDDR